MATTAKDTPPLETQAEPKAIPVTVDGPRPLADLLPPGPELLRKLSAAIQSIEPLPERGRMDAAAGGYSFLRDDDLVRAVSHACALSGLVVLPPRVLSVEQRRPDRVTRDGQVVPGSHYATVTIEIWIADPDTGQGWRGVAAGEGQDTLDKAISKAQTSAVKHWLKQAFMVTTEDPRAPMPGRRDPITPGQYDEAKALWAARNATAEDVARLHDFLDSIDAPKRETIAQRIAALTESQASRLLAELREAAAT